MELKKLKNRKAKIIPNAVVSLGTVPKSMVKGQVEIEKSVGESKPLRLQHCNDRLD